MWVPAKFIIIMVSDGNGWTLMLSSGHGWDLSSG